MNNNSPNQVIDIGYIAAYRTIMLINMSWRRSRGVAFIVCYGAIYMGF